VPYQDKIFKTISPQRTCLIRKWLRWNFRGPKSSKKIDEISRGRFAELMVLESWLDIYSRDSETAKEWPD
jgi:hypothetical protein